MAIKMLCVLLAVCVTVKLTSAIVCLPDMCKSVTQPLLDCQGGVVKNGGFCGCTDVCAKVEGETCQAEIMFGTIPAGSCDEGLQCIRQSHMAFGRGTCVKTVQKREDRPKTLCEQMRLSSMISMVVYEGQWFAKCDPDGNFMPMQCDNTRHCFCVNTSTGQVLEGTKVLGTAQC